jgi:tetratricopeptide (TPR) repeat protein
MHLSRKLSGRAIVCLTSLLSLGACAGTVKAPRQIADLDREALDAYEAGEFARARTLLLKAVAAGKKAQLEDDPVMARAYLDLGAVNLADNDRGEALRDFGIALAIDPSIEPSVDIASPALKKVLAVAAIQLRRHRGAAFSAVEAWKKEREVATADDDSDRPKRKAKRPPPAAEDEDSEDRLAREPAPTRAAKESAELAKEDRPAAVEDQEPDVPANLSQPLFCPVPDEAPPEAEVPLRCIGAPGLAVSSMVLWYRPAGSENFTSVPMVRSRKGWYQGVVPASALVGKTLQYYVEAMGPTKTVAGSNGQADSPNLVIIRPGAAPVGRGELAAVQYQRRGAAAQVDEDPLARSEEKRQRAAAVVSVNRRRPNALWVGLGLGSGVGWHPRRQLEFRTEDAVASGFSRAGLMQVTPEVGWQINEDWAVSLQSRHQIIPESGSGDDRLGAPAHGALAIFLRGYRYFGQGHGQPFVSGAIGFGEGFRLVVPPHPEMGVVRNDTIRGGPFVVGPGGGYLYNFSNHFGWAAEARFLAGLPDKAALIEFLTGAQLAF